MSVIVKSGGGKSSGLYVWKKYNAVIGLGESRDNIALANDGTSIDTYVKENLYIKEDGTIGVQGEPYSTVSISSVVEDTCIGGMTPTKYCIGVDGNVYSSPLSHIEGSVDNCVANLVIAVKGTFIDFVVSDSETAYPDGGEQGNYYYEMFDGSGLYVWKKYQYMPPVTVTNPTFTGVIDSTLPNSIVITTSSFDKTAITDIDFFSGFTTSDGTYHFDYADGVLNYYWGTGSTQHWEVTEYDNTTFEIKTSNVPTKGTFNFTYTGAKTIQGVVGDFIDYVVSDQENAYPDGGEQGGYWYEKVVEGIDLALFGCTKYAIDKFTFSSQKDWNNSIVISHSLGEIPKFFIILSERKSSTKKDLVKVIGFLGNSPYNSAVSGFVNTTSSLYTTLCTLESTATDITTKTDSANHTNFAAGIEYTLITMA